MGFSVYPTPSSGGIKSVQRGVAASSGDVTISSVNIAKSFVTIYGTTSSGTVAASGSVNAANGNAAARTGAVGAANTTNVGGPGNGNTNGRFNLDAGTISLNSTNLTGGETNLVAAVVQGYLSNSTTLVVSGACRWEVVEFN